MATAIASIKQEGTDVVLPLINEADFGFKVDRGNNRIFFSLKAMNGIGTEAVQNMIANRPYKSIEDFGERMLKSKEILSDSGEITKVPALIKTSQMVQLIKGGCFTELHSKNRKETMEWFLKNYLFNPCEKLTMQQFGKMEELELIPENMKLAAHIVNFKKYVLDDEGLIEKYIDPEKKKIPKRGYHDGRYILDSNSQPFFMEHFSENSVVDVKNEFYIVSEKLFSKEADTKIQPLKDWLTEPETLQKYNDALYQMLWNKHAAGTLPHWSMESLCYYDDEHELEHVKEEVYGIVNFFDLPEEPEPYEWYTRYFNGKPKHLPKYKISRIAGTVLNADNNHYLVTILTKYGVVNVKMNKGHYAFYNKQISARLDENSDKKTRLESSWLKRGNLIVIAGIRRGEQFIPKIYKDTIYKHTVNLIKEVYSDGTLLLQSERTQV